MKKRNVEVNVSAAAEAVPAEEASGAAKKHYSLREVVDMAKDVSEVAKTGMKTVDTVKKYVVPVLLVGFTAAAYALTGEKLGDKKQKV